MKEWRIYTFTSHILLLPDDVKEEWMPWIKWMKEWMEQIGMDKVWMEGNGDIYGWMDRMEKKGNQMELTKKA